VLASIGCNGQPPWFRQIDCISPGHVVNAALATGLGVPDVVARLTMLGLDTSRLEMFPDTVDARDLTMLSTRLPGPDWLSPTQPVSPGHVLAVAGRLGVAPEMVAARLREFGLEVHGPDTWPEPGKIVLTVASFNLTGEYPWLAPQTSVSPGHVLAAAKECECDIDEVLATLRALSFRVPAAGVLAGPFDEQDILLLGGDSANWVDPDRQVPVGHVAWASTETGLSVADVVRRLAAFGLRVGDASQYPDHYDPDDLVLLSRDMDGLVPWCDDLTSLTEHDVILATTKVRRSARSVAQRARELGIGAPEPSTLPDKFDSDDETIVSVDVDGSPPWLDRREQVTMPHLITAVADTRRSVADVSQRLHDLGYLRVSVPEQWDREDEVLLSEDLDGKKPWLVGEQIPPSHLVKIWRSGRDVVKSVRRLMRLGMRLPDGIELADS
jgi:hypothetical protein